MSDNDFDVLNGKLDLLIDSTTQLNLNQIKMFELLSERSKDVITKEMGGEKLTTSVRREGNALNLESVKDALQTSDSKPPIVSEHVSGVNLEATTDFVIPMKNAKFTWYRFADQEGRVRKCDNEGCNLFLKYNEDKKKYEHWKFDPNTGKGGYLADRCEGIYSA